FFLCFFLFVFCGFCGFCGFFFVLVFFFVVCFGGWFWECLGVLGFGSWSLWLGLLFWCFGWF
ncbi:hypothetical protein, partial [Pseudomonas syringae group genomosp. 7]|uniref:hypothetical protein n=1 Tax=Pseudomonas syringae group genomosp. 7 TaxID=251699 RepID=UPI0037700C5E